MMLLIFLIAFLINFIDLIIFQISEFSFFKEFKKLRDLNSNKLPVFFILFLGPFMEEIIFRLPLKLKKINIVLSLSFLSIYFIGDKIVDINIYSFYTWIKIVPIFFISIFFYICVKDSLMEAINKKYFKTFFYLFTISFGLIHIVNFYKIVPSNLVYLTPIFVLPQIVLSFFIAYIRMKNGFIWGFFLHSLYNLPITLFYLLKT